jgi:hypothetical protein
MRGALEPRATSRLTNMPTAQRANGGGAAAKIHFLDTPVNTIRSRLQQRNTNLPPFNFHINPATLEGFLSLFEAPSDQEGAGLAKTG